MNIPTNPDPLLEYLSMAPLSLAFERAIEARIFAALVFERPVLDIGCGEGLFASIAFKEPVDAGIDPNARELERARQLGAYYELIECSGAEVPKPDGSYNTVFANSVYEHIQDLEPVIREACRLLAPGGRMYVTVPSERFEQFTVANRLLSGIGLVDLSKKYRAFYNSFWRHYHCLSADRWQKLMRRCGFEIVDSFTYNPSGMCLLDDLLIPFGAPGLVLKRLTNRWTMSPAIRRLLLYPVYRVMKPQIERGVRVEDGGLVFLSLRKAP